MNAFSVAGVLFSLAGVVAGVRGDIPIAAVNVCVGLVFVTLSIKKRNEKDKQD